MVLPIFMIHNHKLEQKFNVATLVFILQLLLMMKNVTQRMDNVNLMMKTLKQVFIISTYNVCDIIIKKMDRSPRTWMILPKVETCLKIDLDIK